MKKEQVEIYSDASNLAVMRHPGREFPGSLIQGDSLHSLLQNVKEAKEEIDSGNGQDASEILEDIIDNLTYICRCCGVFSAVFFNNVVRI